MSAAYPCWEAVAVAVPVFDLTRQWEQLRDDVTKAMTPVLESGHFILGEQVSQLESEIATLCGTEYAIGVANGSDAIYLALRALGIGPGDEVIVPAFTFFATAGSVSRTGATPVFADIDPLTYNIDCADAEHRITPRTRAIVPVHLYGQPADMDELIELAEAHNLFVVEDGAQAIGARYKGRPVGSMGHAATLSFFPTKNLGCYGDGGMVVTRDPDLAERIRVLRVHGSKPKYYHSVLGINSRLDALQAAVLLGKLPHLDRWTTRRREIAALYNQCLADIPGLQLPQENAESYHVYHQYTVRCTRRDELQAGLKSQGIGSAIYYPLALHLQEVFADLGYSAGDLPHAERATREVLSLPMFPELTDSEVHEVAAAVCRVLG
jgi:dTDP-4-amino-4,6-dideoxygalactose transaminase